MFVGKNARAQATWPVKRTPGGLLQRPPGWEDLGPSAPVGKNASPQHVGREEHQAAWLGRRQAGQVDMLVFFLTACWGPSPPGVMLFLPRHAGSQAFLPRRTEGQCSCQGKTCWATFWEAFLQRFCWEPGQLVLLTGWGPSPGVLAKTALP